MTKLKEIKDYLDSNKLLIYDNLFKEYVKDKEIYIYGYDYINKYYKSILDNYNYKVIDLDRTRPQVPDPGFCEFREGERLEKFHQCLHFPREILFSP